MLATCPALLLHGAPGSGTKLLTAALSKVSPCVESAVDPVRVTSAVISAPAVSPVAPLLGGISSLVQQQLVAQRLNRNPVARPSIASPAYSGSGLTAM